MWKEEKFCECAVCSNEPFNNLKLHRLRKFAVRNTAAVLRVERWKGKRACIFNGVLAIWLINTSLSYSRHAHLAVQTNKKAETVVLAVNGSAVLTKCMFSAQVKLCNRTYSYDDVKFTVMNGLLWDVILGREFLKQHKSVNFNFGGPEHSLRHRVFEPLKRPHPVRLFEHMTFDCNPTAAKSRYYLQTDQKFTEIQIQ